jgi:hypothetical protein
VPRPRLLRARQASHALEPNSRELDIERSETRRYHPQQFVAYVFDDVHLEFADLFNAKAAALRHLASLPPNDRIAIFSTSGFSMLDFTDDHAKVRESISKLQPAPFAPEWTSNSPT